MEGDPTHAASDTIDAISTGTGAPVLRFAPSPNGRLHLGHAWSALINRRMADRIGGRLLLRMEDIDLGRCTPELERGVLDDLAWLGVRFDGPVVRQSERTALYDAAIDRLRDMGLAYPAFLSRREVREVIARDPDWPHDPDGAPRYPTGERDLDPDEAARRIAVGEPHAWRLNVDQATRRAGALEWMEAGADGTPTLHVRADPLAWGDVVLARVDAPASYHLAATIDDAAQGITHIVRGRDLFRATAVHRLLRVLLGLPEPAHYHHGLLTVEGRKLAKSRQTGTPLDMTLAALRESGLAPEDVRAMLPA